MDDKEYGFVDYGFGRRFNLVLSYSYLGSQSRPQSQSQLQSQSQSQSRSQSNSHSQSCSHWGLQSESIQSTHINLQNQLSSASNRTLELKSCELTIGPNYEDFNINFTLHRFKEVTYSHGFSTKYFTKLKTVELDNSVRGINDENKYGDNNSNNNNIKNNSIQAERVEKGWQSSLLSLCQSRSCELGTQPELKFIYSVFIKAKFLKSSHPIKTQAIEEYDADADLNFNNFDESGENLLVDAESFQELLAWITQNKIYIGSMRWMYSKKLNHFVFLGQKDAFFNQKYIPVTARTKHFYLRSELVQNIYSYFSLDLLDEIFIIEFTFENNNELKISDWLEALDVFQSNVKWVQGPLICFLINFIKANNVGVTIDNQISHENLWLSSGYTFLFAGNKEQINKRWATFARPIGYFIKEQKLVYRNHTFIV